MMDDNYHWVKQVLSSSSAAAAGTISSTSTSSSTSDNNHHSFNTVIPLGKILEVFGPVSRPLYTVRLLLLNDSKLNHHDQGHKNNDNEVDDKLEHKNVVQNETNVCTTNNNDDDDDDLDLVTKDPWSDDGVLTNWIKSKPSLDVYYATNQVKFVDKQSVARNSRKGCGKL